ncbi:MAG: hypothetical protein M3345_00695 [Actinomycetota bacterium]|nr:hypothetical protein [Actinomycetota bacterium]
MGNSQSLPRWEEELIDDAIVQAESRLSSENARARKRAVQLAREQGYHRLAVAIDRGSRARSSVSPDQLSFFALEPTLFDDAG